MTFYLAFWYATGLIFVFACFKAFEAGRLAGPYTYGKLVLTMMLAVLGPIAIPFAIGWWICALSGDDFKFKGAFHRWWNKPL